MTVFMRGRRQFLIGTGGFALAIPFLSSLEPRGTKAQATPRKPRFVSLVTPHGGLHYDSLYPSDAVLTETQNLYSDHLIRRGDLKLASQDGSSSLSPVLTASSALLTDGLTKKMNVLLGFDIPFEVSHQTGAHLGNFARNDNTVSNTAERAKQGGYIPTIDQVMAWSPSFYADLSTNRTRSIHVGMTGQVSWSYSDPRNKTGDVVAIPTAESSLNLFKSVFIAPRASSDEVKRVPVVDRVLESYNRLRNGNWGEGVRLSASDKRRLDEHIGRLSELQRTLTVASSAVSQCSDVVVPPTEEASDHAVATSLSDTIRYHQLYNEIIAVAFMCGTSRIAVINAYEPWAEYSGDWHQDIAHQYALPGPQAALVDANRTVFDRCFLDLAQRLDVEEDEGSTYLDNTLMAWTMESGPDTHNSLSLPVITLGSASGALRTGLYADYRNRENTSIAHPEWGSYHGEARPGLLYNQWLATALQAMGVPPSEYERDGLRGYGTQYLDNVQNPDSSTLSWPDRLRNDASNMLPFLATSTG
ncbi:MAG: DUF1552 domain-containing protein [Myxococcales bacterium]